MDNYDINSHSFGYYFKLEGNNIVQYTYKKRRKKYIKEIELFTTDGKYYGTNKEETYSDWESYEERIDTDGLNCSIVNINFKFYKLYHNIGESTMTDIHYLNEALNNSGLKCSVITRITDSDIIDRPVIPLLKSTCSRFIISKDPKIIFDFDYEKFNTNKKSMLENLLYYKNVQFYNEVVYELNWLFDKTIEYISRYYMVSEKSLIKNNFCKVNSLNKRINKYSENKWRYIEYYPVNQIV